MTASADFVSRPAPAPERAAPSAAAAPTTSFGRSAFEFLIVGGATLLLVPLSLLYQSKAGVDRSVYNISWVAFYLAYVINDPHFSVSYFLFYKNAKSRALGDEFPPMQRFRYIIAGFVVPILLLGWGAWGIFADSPQTIGLMVQLMYLTVGWHYVKQGFGVLAVLSARRGVSFEPLERRVILAHCFSGWAFGWINPYPGGLMEEEGVQYYTLTVPGGPVLHEIAKWLFVLTAVALFAIFARKWVRGRRMPPLVPLSGLLISVWLWTVWPNFDPLVAYAIPALHSIQYLYFVYLMKKNETKATPGPALFRGKTWLRVGAFVLTVWCLGYILFHGGPSLLDQSLAVAGAKVGPTPFLAVIATFVNVHHYFMDHVIWRRENPDTRYLRG